MTCIPTADEDALSQFTISIVHAMEDRFHHAWNYIFSVIPTFFKCFASSCNPALSTPCLDRILAILQRQHASHVDRSKFDQALREAAGAAVRHISARIVLEKVPIRAISKSKFVIAASAFCFNTHRIASPTHGSSRF
jgi:hypothetical protein